MSNFFKHLSVSDELIVLGEKILTGTRINQSEAMLLYEEAPLAWLGLLANERKMAVSGKDVYFNKNFHIEPTNICIYKCNFCSFRRNVGETGSWELSLDEMMDQVKTKAAGATEVHVVGGVHPKYTVEYFADLILKIKKEAPHLHVKGFTAVEIEHMCRKSRLSLEEGLKTLKDAGLESLPGGGAEIFDAELRKEICGEKSTSEMWLGVHRTAHLVGLPSNCTILYGHKETYAHRLDHLERLRSLQDETGGFNAFIPLKFKKANNSMEAYGEVSIIEDLRNFAVSRIYLDNIPHLKAYWPMIGKDVAQLSLGYGVDDLDGTIDDSTAIYSMAGGEDSPSASSQELIKLIEDSGKVPVERDSVYNTIA
ncbi:MAG: aminofutalosine synthase MqnE [Bacteroidales bacterium]